MVPNDTDKRPCFNIFKAAKEHEIAAQYGLNDPQEIHMKALEIWMNSSTEYKNSFKDNVPKSPPPIREPDDSPKFKFHYYQPKIDTPVPLVIYPKLFPNTYTKTPCSTNRASRSPNLEMKSPSTQSSTSDINPNEFFKSVSHNHFSPEPKCNVFAISIPKVSLDVVEATRLDWSVDPLVNEPVDKLEIKQNTFKSSLIRKVKLNSDENGYMVGLCWPK
ncbi:hypothetical protein HDV01_004713 [Terramyces sp. JEL0728]|nr:hypothetical protein HDV01_004713 [Terramyces sp. JEL0728]